MSNEATLRVSLNIKTGSMDFRSSPTAFNADVSQASQGSPGGMTVAVTGTDVDMSQITIPGFCWLQNLDPTNYVEYGIKDSISGNFYPLGELLPGECYLLRLSRYILQELAGTGTGIVASSTFHLKAAAAPCRCIVRVFEL